MCAHSFTCASVYVIFVALPLLLQARLIFQWATKIYCRSLQGISEEKPECSAGLSEHDSDWLQQHHLFHHLHLHEWTKGKVAHDEHNAVGRMKASTALWSLVGTSFVFGSNLLCDFDDSPRTIGESVYSHFWSNTRAFVNILWSMHHCFLIFCCEGVASY